MFLFSPLCWPYFPHFVCQAQSCSGVSGVPEYTFQMEDEFQELLQQYQTSDQVRDTLISLGFDCTLTFRLAFSSMQMLDHTSRSSYLQEKMTLLHQHALEFEDYVQNATLFIHPLPSLLLKPSLQLLYLLLRLQSWIHHPTGTNESLPPKLSTAQFEKNYPGEVLDAHSTPSVRLWSLVHQQKVNKAIKYIPIQLRLSEHQCSAMIETRSSKPLRSEIQLLSQLCWDDTPEMDINSVRFFRDWFNRTPTPQFSGMHMYYVVCVTYKYSKLSTPRLQNTPLFNSIKSWGWGTQSLKNSSVLTRRFGVLSHSCIRMALGLSKNASTRWLLSDLTYHHYFNHVLEYQKHYLRHGMARAKVEKAKEEKAQEEKARPNHTSSTRGISVPMDSTTTIKLHYVWNIMLVSASVTTVTTSMRAQFAFKADDHVCKTTQQRLTKDPPDSVITPPIYRPQTITYTVTNQFQPTGTSTDHLTIDEASHTSPPPTPTSPVHQGTITTVDSIGAHSHSFLVDPNSPPLQTTDTSAYKQHPKIIPISTSTPVTQPIRWFFGYFCRTLSSTFVSAEANVDHLSPFGIEFDPSCDILNDDVFENLLKLAHSGLVGAIWFCPSLPPLLIT